VSVSEAAIPPRELLTVSATDADCLDTPKITYRIVIGGGCGSGGGCLFSINASTGVLSLQSSLDYEATRVHVITVEASDNFVGSPRTTTVAVTVTVENAFDEPPRFARDPFEATIDEGDYINERVVALTATDADSGDTLVFALVDGSGIFDVDRNSGNVTVTGASESPLCFPCASPVPFQQHQPCGLCSRFLYNPSISQHARSPPLARPFHPKYHLV
jgi:hypothetical protein